VSSNITPPPSVPRQFCRNRRCGAELPAAAVNPRNQFCCRNCEASFYRVRCRVCERQLPQPKTGRPRALCSDRCRNRFRRHQEWFLSRYFLGPKPAPKRSENPSRYIASKVSENPRGNSIKSGAKSRPSGDRPWRMIAGPPVSEINLRIPLDPDTAPRVECGLKPFHDYWRRVKWRAARAAMIKRRSTPLNVLSGHKFAGAPAVDLSPLPSADTPIIQSNWSPVDPGDGFGNDLWISGLLRRTPSGDCPSSVSAVPRPTVDKPTDAMRGAGRSQMVASRKKKEVEHA
jgi:hypothetical protein